MSTRDETPAERWVREFAENAPKLTDGQRARLAELFDVWGEGS